MYGQFGNDTYVFAGSDLGKDVLYEAGDYPASHHGDDVHHYDHLYHAETAANNDNHDVLDFSEFDGAVYVNLQDGHALNLVQGHDYEQEHHQHELGHALGVEHHSHYGFDLDLLMIDPSGFEDVIGSAYDDVISGNSRNNTLQGMAGSDWLFGDGGDDLILGGSGNDFILGGSGDDILDGGLGNDIIYGAGCYGHDHDHDHDDHHFQIFHDNYHHDHGHDDRGHDLSRNIILGGEGDDWLYGGAGDDLIDGEGGNDKIFGNQGNDILLGGSGNDRLLAGAGNDILEGGPGDDRLIASRHDSVEQDQGAGLLGLAQYFADFAADYSLDTFHYSDPTGGDPTATDDRPARAWLEDFIGQIAMPEVVVLTGAGDAVLQSLLSEVVCEADEPVFTPLPDLSLPDTVTDRSQVDEQSGRQEDEFEVLVFDSQLGGFSVDKGQSDDDKPAAQGTSLPNNTSSDDDWVVYTASNEDGQGGDGGKDDARSRKGDSKTNVIDWQKGTKDFEGMIPPAPAGRSGMVNSAVNWL